MTSSVVTRRRFLEGSTALTVAAHVARLARAQDAAAGSDPKQLESTVSRGIDFLNLQLSAVERTKVRVRARRLATNWEAELPHFFEHERHE